MSLSQLGHDVVYYALALPDPEPVAPPGFEAVSTILGWAKWVGLIAAVLALIFVAVLFMFNSRRGEGGEHIKTFVSILIGVMIIGAATALVGFISGA
ncbi:hypothetical protein Q9S71_14960 [Microbacterium sp. KSW4-11]|uniref:TrbC/VIRB2 family protein n=2 Tax=Microbacterium TaxID=33882 RepID=A0A498BQR0_9MICO|nr:MULTISPECIES: hypothetical protein [Microbacterium]MDT3318126.1 hypothetical protein [Microbacterium sp. KSW4-11]RLK46464.1 hypothetical protein C7474_3002 [Microbacterium telephonicum]